MADVLVDTEVFIDHLRGVHELQAGKHRVAYFVVTRAELFAGTTATDAVARLLSPFREFAATARTQHAPDASESDEAKSPARARAGGPSLL